MLNEEYNSAKIIEKTLYENQLHADASQFAFNDENKKRIPTIDQDLTEQLANQCIEDEAIGLTAAIEEIQIFDKRTDEWKRIDRFSEEANEQLMSSDMIRIGGNFMNQEGSIATDETIELYNVNAHIYEDHLIAIGTNEDGIDMMVSDLPIAKEIKIELETGKEKAQEEEIAEPEISM